MDDRVTCYLCGQPKPAADFYESELATKRFRECLRISRQRSVNEDHTKYLRRLTAQLKSQRLKSNFTWEIKPQDVIDLWESQAGKCAISGLNMTHHRTNEGGKSAFNASIDRINNLEGYVKNNIQLVCNQTNTMRHTLNVGEFWWWIKTIYQHQNKE